MSTVKLGCPQPPIKLFASYDRAQTGSYIADMSSDHSPSNGPSTHCGRRACSSSATWSRLPSGTLADRPRSSQAGPPGSRAWRRAGVPASWWPTSWGSETPPDIGSQLVLWSPAGGQGSGRGRKWGFWWDPEWRVCGGKYLARKSLYRQAENPLQSLYSGMKGKRRRGEGVVIEVEM